eukprot:g2117.t1
MRRLLFFDLETTGFSRSRDRVIELSIYDPLKKRAVLNTLVNPNRSVPRHITALTGIENRDVASSKVPPFEHVAERMVRDLSRLGKSDGVLLVGHNARRFDAPFLLTEMSRYGLEIPSGVEFSDSLDALRSVFKRKGDKRTDADTPQKFSLKYLRDFFRLDDGHPHQTHRALDDCILLSDVLARVEGQFGINMTQELERHEFEASAASFAGDSAYVYKKRHRRATSSATTTPDGTETTSLSCADALKSLTLPPMLRQYCETKGSHVSASSSSSEHPLLLYRVGDFYEAYFEDAPRLGAALDMVVTAKQIARKSKQSERRSRDVSGDQKKETTTLRVPMCGFPVRAAARHCRSLMKGGHVVIVCDQTETAAAAASKGAATVERKVTRVLTPGTVIEEDLLDAERPSYLVALYVPRSSSSSWGLCYADVATGECRSTEGDGASALKSELQRLGPAELIVPANLDNESYTYGEASNQNDSRVASLLSLDGSSAHLFGSLCFAPASSFSTLGAARYVREYHGLASLEGVGLHQRPLATSATAALLRYVEHTRPNTPRSTNVAKGDSRRGRSLQLPKCYDVDDCMIIDEDTWRNLEISHTARTGSAQGSLFRAIDRSETAMGRRLLHEWLRRPLRCPKRIAKRQDAVREFVHDHDSRLRLRSVMRSMNDISRLASRAASGTASPNCLLTLADSIARLPTIAKTVESRDSVSRACSTALRLDFLSDPNLQRWAAQVRNTLAAISGDAVSDGHSTWISNMFAASSGATTAPLLRPGADDEVDRLRCEAAETLSAMEEVVERERRELEVPALTLRATRMFGHVIAVPSRSMRAFSVPDHFRRLQSLKAEERFSTAELVDLDARAKRMEAQAAAREQVVFDGLLTDAARLAPELRDAGSAVAQLDVLSGLATIAADEFYCAPTVLPARERRLDIVDGRHPVVEQFGCAGRGCVPNSVSLSSAVIVDDDDASELEDTQEVDPHRTGDASLIVLTGPNAAGKSVFLRQTAVIQLLAQIGSFVPASHASLSVVDRIFTRAGGADDVSQGQSTFMVEMSETANILNHATSESLVLLDEIGRGTATYDGLALAQSVSEHLSQSVGCRTIFATHYHELNELARAHANVATMHAVVVPADDGSIAFTFEMASGGAERSHGIEVAKLVGFPGVVSDRAEDILRDLEGVVVDDDDERGLGEVLN